MLDMAVLCEECGGAGFVAVVVVCGDLVGVWAWMW